MRTVPKRTDAIPGQMTASDLPPFRVLNYSVDTHVCTLTLNRPARRNALSAELVNEIIVGLETATADPDVRVIVLQGAGGAFCSGGDLSAMSGGAGDDQGPQVPFRGGFVELLQGFSDCPNGRRKSL